MDTPRVYTTLERQIITVRVDPENDRWMAMLAKNPVEWSKVGSSEAEAIGFLVMALDEFRQSQEG